MASVLLELGCLFLILLMTFFKAEVAKSVFPESFDSPKLTIVSKSSLGIFVFYNGAGPASPSSVFVSKPPDSGFFVDSSLVSSSKITSSLIKS